MLRDLTHRLQEKDERIEQLLQRLDLLLRRTYGHRAETIDMSQLRLAFAEILTEPALPSAVEDPAQRAVREAFGSEPKPEERKPKRKGHGRSRLPEHLQR